MAIFFNDFTGYLVINLVSIFYCLKASHGQWGMEYRGW